MRHLLTALVLIFSFGFTSINDYPIDGYARTGIRRLDYLNKLYKDEIKGRKKLPPGALFPLDHVKLNLMDDRGAQIDGLPEVDEQFQTEIRSIFHGMDPHYSLTALDVTPGKPLRYAQMKETTGYQPGSVGKLVILAAFFTELAKVEMGDFDKRIELLKKKQVTAGDWALYDHHTIPVYDEETGQYTHRKVRADDVFSMFEWLDNMVSPSNNGAASVCWRETLLMHKFGAHYADLSYEEGEIYFNNTPKSELSQIAIDVINQPLRDMGISSDEWRLGSLFTGGARGHIPPRGGSIGTPIGLMKYIVHMEQGKIVDPETSLEMKRLLYMTGRRIRYAASPKLSEAAVYFKSGSLYKCSESGKCGAYMGDVENFMNSVAIVEHPNGARYIVCLMSNVKRKNSAYDHLELANKIDDLFKG